MLSPWTGGPWEPIEQSFCSVNTDAHLSVCSHNVPSDRNFASHVSTFHCQIFIAHTSSHHFHFHEPLLDIVVILFIYEQPLLLCLEPKATCLI